ncbi:MAG: protein kinase [Myxococcaceae bacterium]|nr:protein kinase [Myxococcaceae bacterium]
MQRAPGPALHPALLPPGSLVGRWLIVAWAGQGVHGAVYKAVPADNERAAPVALKLALLPRDPRFEREVELLSSTRHPSVPRLWDHGEWLHPSGTSHPYLVMDWIEGTPLYDQARQSLPTSQQVLQWLAQLASALQSLHAQGCSHRDVKGGNVLVRHSDGRAVLTDLGSGIFPDAPSLTPDTLPPGTPAYRSPEACLFPLQFIRERSARYRAQPADDLYALGVTAYRLVTGEYPELAEPSQDEAGSWHVEGIASPAPRVLNPRVAPQLSALILRMLSARPEERGPTAALAQALEQAAELSAPELAQPLFAAEVQPPAEPSHAPVPAEPVRLPPRTLPWRPWLVLAAASLALFTWAWWVAPARPVETLSAAQREAAPVGQPDGGSVGLGDAASATSAVDSPARPVREAPAEDQLPEPQPGQTQPDANGLCPYKRQVALNGGCWTRLKMARAECEENGGYMFQSACYLPISARGRQPTSDPLRKP